MKTPSPSSSAFNASHDDHGIPPWEEASARFQDEDDAFDLADTVNEAPESEPDSSLYSTLAIDPTASEEQVKAAYKRAALAFHPDKTGSTGNTEAAEREFARVQRAYDVLSNPRLRQIYDARGDRGLADASALGPRLTTAEEIIKELEKLEGQRAKEAVNKLVAAKGQLVLGIDATRLLHPRLPPNYTYSTLLKRLPSLTPSLQHATVTHAFSAPLTDSLKLSFRGSATARNGLGGTTLATTLHAPLPYNTQSEWTVVVNPVGEHSVSLKTATRLEDVAIQAQLASQGFNFPSFSMTAARTLWAGLNGFASYAHPSFFSDSEDSSFTLGLASDNWESQLTASPADSRLESTYSFPLRVPFTTSRSIRILLSASYSLARGLSYNLGLTRPFGAAKLNVTFESSGAGVSMLFRWNWMGQRLAIPVMLAHGFEPETSFWGFASCVAVLWGLDEFYLIPKRKKARIEARKAAREAKAELLESKKKDAEQAQSLLRPLAERKADAEGRKGGLVVLSADYAGFDVTVPLQAAVEGGQLRLGAVSKASIPGFFNPSDGKPTLNVRYRFNNALHSVSIADTLPLVLPMREHILPNEHDDVHDAIPVPGARSIGSSEGGIAGPERSRF